MKRSVKNVLASAGRKCLDVLTSRRFQMVCAMLIVCGASAFAQNYAAGTSALTTVSTEIAKYVPIVQKVIYAIAGVVVLGGAISVFIKMNNEEQDVKKSIMMIVGSCVFLIAAATALPLFFGISGS